MDKYIIPAPSAGREKVNDSVVTQMTKKTGDCRSIRRQGFFEPFRVLEKIHTLSLSNITLVMMLQFTHPVNAEEILVVSGKEAPVDDLSRSETANLFLGLERATPSLTPYDQREKELRKDFYQEVAGRSLASVRAHWAKRVFTGRGRPPAMLDADQVEQTIEQDSGAVTYVPDVRLPKNGKVLLHLPRDDRQ